MAQLTASTQGEYEQSITPLAPDTGGNFAMSAVDSAAGFSMLQLLFLAVVGLCVLASIGYSMTRS